MAEANANMSAHELRALREIRLPCELDFGGVRFGKGVELGTVLDAAKRWLAQARLTPAGAGEGAGERERFIELLLSGNSGLQAEEESARDASLKEFEALGWVKPYDWAFGRTYYHITEAGRVAATPSPAAAEAMREACGRCDALSESAYKAGATAGWNLGLSEDRDGLTRLLEAHGGSLGGLRDHCALAEGAAGREACDLGVGCDETGVCYAEAHGEPERCGRALPVPAGEAARRGQVEAICRAVCRVEGLDPDEPDDEDRDPNWTRYAGAVAGALNEGGERAPS